MRKFLIGFLFLAAFSPASALELPITVKETAGVGASSFPVSVVVPLPEGQYQTTGGFGLRDPAGPVPAQFEVISRWWNKDNSIRHVLVHFQATVSTQGQTQYTFTDAGSNPSPTDAVRIDETADRITVTTGPIKFTVRKSAFNILDEVFYDLDDDGAYDSSERMILSDSAHGGRFDGCTNVSSGACTPQAQHDSTMPTPEIVVEERGPMRAVIRVELPTSYSGINDHKHGYAVRIYAYAGRSDIKVDYQLQNSAKGPNLDGDRFANPLYYNALNLEWSLQLSGNATVKVGKGDGSVDTRLLGTSGMELAHTLHDRYQIRASTGGTVYTDCGNNCFADGFMDVSDSTWGVTAHIRNLWELWPGGIEVEQGGRLSVQLFPDWSAQWHGGSLSGSGLYWLDDMRHVYKEVFLRFHGDAPSDADLVAYSRTADRHPVPTLPVGYYASTGVTFDPTGENPLDTPVGSGGLLEVNSAGDLDENNSNYRMGWNRWYPPEVSRLFDARAGGGGPASGEWFMASESPQHFWHAERWAISELNARPQWMAAYTHQADWNQLGLTQAPYAGGDWRAQGNTARYSIGGTGKENMARDDQHNWVYHVGDFYWFSGNLWVKDWYRFVGEFRRPRLLRVEASPAESERAIGHALETVVQAYRMTGDVSLIDQFADYVGTYLLPKLHPLCGHIRGSLGSANPVAFQNRVIQDGLGHFKGYDWPRWARMFNYVSAYHEWHYNFGRYGYHVNDSAGDCSTNSSSAGTGWNVPDTMSWYYWNTGKTRFKTMNDDYVDGGLNGGNEPYVCCGWDRDAWEGGWARRYYDWENSNIRSDQSPPAAITDVSAVQSESIVEATWSGPTDAEYYLVVWSDRPVSEAQNDDTNNFRNWWAAAPTATTATSITLEVGSAAQVYVAVFSFDAQDNMSAISNVVVATPGSLDPPSPPSRLRVDPS